MKIKTEQDTIKIEMSVEEAQELCTACNEGWAELGHTFGVEEINHDHPLALLADLLCGERIRLHKKEE